MEAAVQVSEEEIKVPVSEIITNKEVSTKLVPFTEIVKNNKKKKVKKKKKI